MMKKRLTVAPDGVRVEPIVASLSRPSAAAAVEAAQRRRRRRHPNSWENRGLASERASDNSRASAWRKAGPSVHAENMKP